MASGNLIFNPEAAVNLTNIVKVIGDETHSRQSGATGISGVSTFVRSVNPATNFDGIQFLGAAVPEGATVVGGVYARGAVGGEPVSILTRITYSDASFSQTFVSVNLTTSFVLYVPASFAGTVGKTPTGVSVLVINNGAIAQTFEATAAQAATGTSLPPYDWPGNQGQGAIGLILGLV